MKDEDLDTYYLCDCHDMSHAMRVSFNADKVDGKQPEPDDFCYVEFGMYNWNGFFGRIWVALKFIFSGDFPFSDIVLRKEDIIKLRDHLNNKINPPKKRNK